jgi:thiamine biosynthesis protein ThiI
LNPGDMKDAILLHWAEIGLKGGNRPQFVRRLADRVRQGLEHAQVQAKVGVQGSRMLVTLQVPDQKERALRLLTKIPGVANLAPVLTVESEIEAIKDAAVSALAAAPAGSFKIEARRGFKGFPMNSIEIAQAVGGRCAALSERPVDVHNPGVTVKVEVTHKYTYVSAGTLAGPGGLPVGSTTNLLSFLSGGLDSPVATWKMLRRGARVTGVHFHNRSLQGQAVLEKIEDLAGTLSWSAGVFPLIVVPFESCQRAIVATVPADFRMIVYRRAMFRIAAVIAKREKALGYITGDSLGQVASQTAENIRTIHAAADMPVYAPLIGSDKVEIMKRAREIGTYRTSVRPHDDCCSFLISNRPAVRSTVAEVEAMESAVPWETVIAEAVEKATFQKIRPDPTAL